MHMVFEGHNFIYIFTNANFWLLWICRIKVAPMADIDVKPKQNLVIALNSTRLRSACYDSRTKKLTIRFGRFSKRIHRDIPPGVYNNLVTAHKPDFYYFNYIHPLRSRRKPALVRWMVLASLVALVIALWSFG
jgi:hypothetical protein